MLRASLLLLTSWLQYQELPQLAPLPSFDGVEKSAFNAAECARLPARAIVSMGPSGVLTGGPYQLMARGSNDDEWVGAWHGAFERRQGGKKLLDKNFERAKAVPAPGGQMVALILNEQKIVLVDAATGKEIRQFRGQAGPIGAVAWSPDAKVLAAGVGPAVFLWEAATGKLQRALAGDSVQQVALAFSRDGSKLAGGDGETGQIWDTRTGVLLAKLQDGFYRAEGALAFSPDGAVLVGGCHQDYGEGRGRVGLRQWDVVTGKRIRDLEFGTFSAVAITAQGSEVWASAGRHIYRWQLSSGKLVDRWLAHASDISALVLSRDGKTLTSAGADQRLRHWNAATGEQQALPRGHLGSILAVAFSPDGNSFVSEGEDGTLRHWDALTGQQLRCRPLLTAQRSAGLRQGLDGAALRRTISTAGADNTAAISPDGRLEAIANGLNIGLREQASGETAAIFTPRQGNITSVAFSNDCRTLVSGSAEGGLTVWDLTGCLKGGVRPTVKLSQQQLLEQVELLRSDDAGKAQDAIWTLASAGPAAVPMLEEILPRAGTTARITQWIAELQDPAYAVRARAMKGLTEAADQAEPNLVLVLPKVQDLETRRRIEYLLDRLKNGLVAKRSVQVRRALAVLEYGGSQQARQLLERVAVAMPNDAATPIIRAILGRWKTAN